MLIARSVIGGILLFLGRELNFLLSGSMAALIGLRLTPLLPREWPDWSAYVLVIGLALVAAAIPLRYERAGYFLSGFQAGGLLLVELYAPEVLTVPLLPFLVGGAMACTFFAAMGFATGASLASSTRAPKRTTCGCCASTSAGALSTSAASVRTTSGAAGVTRDPPPGAASPDVDGGMDRSRPETEKAVQPSG